MCVPTVSRILFRPDHRRGKIRKYQKTSRLSLLPLVVAEGAGAEMQKALGTAVFSGMIEVTICGFLSTLTSDG